MDELSKAAELVVAGAAVSQRSQSAKLAPPVSTANPPRYFVRETDIEMRRLFSAVRVDGRPQTIVRELTRDEHRALTERATELRATLWPYVQGERDEIEASIAAMLGGFRSMRQSEDAAADIVAVTASILREFPAWAITKACVKIAQNEAGLDPKWPPNDVQIHAIVSDIVREYRATLVNVEALLVAPVEYRTALPAPSIAPNDVRPTGIEPHAPLIERRPADGNHALRVAADIAAKKAVSRETSGEGIA
jgi:hypothetical protein